jgi:hypothetical protein
MRLAKAIVKEGLDLRGNLLGWEKVLESKFWKRLFWGVWSACFGQ